MANMATLSRLHAKEPARQPVPRELPVRSGGFRRASREEAGVYSLAHPEIMAILSQAPPLDRAHQFAELADREHLMQLLRSPAARAAVKRGLDYQGGARGSSLSVVAPHQSDRRGG